MVGRLISSQIRIICDTKITDISSAQNGSFRGVLKAVIINKDLCICFAGNVGRAQVAIEEINKMVKNSSEIDFIIEHLYEKHISGKQDTDFLIACLKGSKELVRITNGLIERNLNASWIGDQDAFNRYQELFHKSLQFENDGSTETVCKMSSAFGELIKEGKFQSIEQPIITVTTLDGGFNYNIEAHVYPIPQTIPSGVWSVIQFGSASEGAYGYSVFPPNEVGIGAVGIYLFPGNVGIFLHPIYRPDAIIYGNVTPEEFIERVKQEHGIVINEGIKIG